MKMKQKKVAIVRILFINYVDRAHATDIREHQQHRKKK